jgi:hypothetical protein
MDHFYELNCDVCGRRIYFHYDPLGGKFPSKVSGRCTYINITETHSTIGETDDVKLLEKLLIDIGQSSHLSLHYVIMFPFLLLPLLSNDKIIALSKIEYDWQPHGKRMVQDAILTYGEQRLENVLDILESDYGIDCLSFKLDEVIYFENDETDDYSVSSSIIELPTLFKRGFMFSGKSFVSRYLNSILKLDDDSIQFMIDNGFDLRKTIESNHFRLSNLRQEHMQRLLKFLPEPELIAQKLLQHDDHLITYKMLIGSCNVDINHIILSTEPYVDHSYDG